MHICESLFYCVCKETLTIMGRLNEINGVIYGGAGVSACVFIEGVIL